MDHYVDPAREIVPAGLALSILTGLDRLSQEASESFLEGFGAGFEADTNKRSDGEYSTDLHAAKSETRARYALMVLRAAAGVPAEVIAEDVLGKKLTSAYVKHAVTTRRPAAPATS